jgi:alanyl-tRNA synthetase
MKKGFNEEMSKQKSRSKADATKETGDWILVGEDVKTEFIGYEQSYCRSPHCKIPEG